MAANKVSQGSPVPNGYGEQSNEFWKEVPSWAKAWVALMTVGVTILLALGLNIGGFIDKGLDNKMREVEMRGELGKSGLDGLIEVSKGLLEQNAKILEATNEVLRQNTEIIKQQQVVIASARSTKGE